MPRRADLAAPQGVTVFSTVWTLAVRVERSQVVHASEQLDAGIPRQTKSQREIDHMMRCRKTGCTRCT